MYISQTIHDSAIVTIEGE